MDKSPVTHTETSKQIPVLCNQDVVVCGGGPAGVAAALQAARNGLSTTLIEHHGCLGGVWTAGALTWIIDYENKDGILSEILERLQAIEARGSSGEGFGGAGYDVEKMKLLLERMCVEAGVNVRLHTTVVAAARDADNRLSLAITESKSGREAWSAKVFVDATGDGDLAARAGCGFDVGHPDTGETQPMTLMGIVTGIHADQVADFIGGRGRGPKEKFAAEIRAGGHEPSYSMPTIFRLHDTVYGLMCNHQYGASAMSADDLTRATLNAREEVHAVVDALRSRGGIWKDLRLVMTGEKIGVREARRIHGRYTVSLDDLKNGTRHDDSACQVTFHIDVHVTNPSKGKDYDEANRWKTKTYDIPYDALIAKDVDGLLLAGRCISGDFYAHASYRVTGNAVMLGESAGNLAAYMANTSDYTATSFHAESLIHH